MLRDIDLVVWDFDGVFNANCDEDGYIWNRMMEEELDIDAQLLWQELFHKAPGFRPIMSGHICLREALTEILPKAGYTDGADAFMTYWFDRDYYHHEGMDELLADVKAQGIRCVIGTNNEPFRAARIADEWGYAKKADKIYTSGHMGLAKPDHAYWTHIMDEEGVDHPARVLFIDDLPENIESANEYGWKTYQFGDLTKREIGCPIQLRSALGL